MKRSHFSVFVLVFNFIIVLAVFENIKIKTGIQLWQNDVSEFYEIYNN